MVTGGIDPTNFGSHPTTIPPGGVVQNCPASPQSWEAATEMISLGFLGMQEIPRAFKMVCSSIYGPIDHRGL